MWGHGTFFCTPTFPVLRATSRGQEAPPRGSQVRACGLLLWQAGSPRLYLSTRGPGEWLAVNPEAAPLPSRPPLGQPLDSQPATPQVPVEGGSVYCGGSKDGIRMPGL